MEGQLVSSRADNIASIIYGDIVCLSVQLPFRRVGGIEHVFCCREGRLFVGNSRAEATRIRGVRTKGMTENGKAMSGEGEGDRDLKGNTPAPQAPDHLAHADQPGSDADLGKALRTVYQQTVDEEIPPEMLDLLNRLT